MSLLIILKIQSSNIHTADLHRSMPPQPILSAFPGSPEGVCPKSPRHPSHPKTLPGKCCSICIATLQKENRKATPHNSAQLPPLLALCFFFPILTRYRSILIKSYLKSPKFNIFGLQLETGPQPNGFGWPGETVGCPHQWCACSLVGDASDLNGRLGWMDDTRSHNGCLWLWEGSWCIPAGKYAIMCNNYWTQAVCLIWFPILVPRFCTFSMFSGGCICSNGTTNCKKKDRLTPLTSFFPKLCPILTHLLKDPNA